MIGKILVPVDGSAHADKAVALGADLAQKYGGGLVLVQVHLMGHVPDEIRQLSDKPGREQPPMAVGAGHVDAQLPLEVLDDIADKLLERAAKTAAERGVDQPETVKLSGNAAERILEQARESGADTIVMGSRGLSDLKGMLVGSVSHKVAHVFEGHGHHREVSPGGRVGASVPGVPRVDVETRGAAGYRAARARAREDARPGRALDDHALARRPQRGLQERLAVRVRPDQGAEDLHLLAHGRRLAPRRVHRVDQDDVGRARREHVARVVVDAGHAGGHGGRAGVGARACQAIRQQGRDHGVALHQRHRAAARGQHEGVAPEARGGIDHGRAVSTPRPPRAPAPPARPRRGAPGSRRARARTPRRRRPGRRAR
ncbi:MAG: universal stress protein [Halofilum sp. (in: g-proteobacteria)]|nr:universal stress protein [Halofilum sp. (in: g-proteobacteria)]